MKNTKKKNGAAAKGKGRATLSAQQTIPYLSMHPDGVCKLPGGLYTKTVEYEDINYSVASTEDQTAIFSGWSSFLNYFDSSLPFQLSFINRRSHSRSRYQVNIPKADDNYNSVRDEFTGMLKNQIAKSNNGIERSKYITFGIPAEGIAEARPRLERVEADVMGNFKRLGVPSEPMDGRARLALLHSQMHPGSREAFRFSWKDIPQTGLGTKDFIAPDSLDFRQSRTFRIGQYWGAVSYLQIMASELSDKLLAEILELDAEMTVTMHIQTVDQLKAIKTIKGKISDIGKMKVEEQRKAVRSGYDPDILPPDLITFSKDAAELLADLQSRNERMFLLTFTVGDFISGYFELAVEWLSGFISNALAAWQVNPAVTSLLVDGIIAGVGGILTFLPNIFILFLALAFLEDSGYMARVAYVMDGIMGRIGLSGRAFIPMILGFGCSVPAVMASRALEDNKDRMKTMLVTPFMSCSARLPIYILFSQMFFGENAMIAAYSMYVIGLVVAVFVAFILHIVDKKEANGMLIIELPEYKAPSARTIWIYVWEKVKDYLTKAGTVIFLASIAMWLLLNFGIHGYTNEMSESFGAAIGHFILAVLNPIGLGYWQIAVALIAGISAKEVVVSSCAVLFGIANVNSAAGMGALHQALGAAGFGMVNAYCLMIFCLLYIPCFATLATIRKESGSIKFMFLAAGFQLVMAWLASFVVFQIF